MTRSDDLADRDRRVVWHPFTQMNLWQQSDPIIIERAEGNELIATDGRRYLDGVSSLWTNVHGHRKKEIDDAVRAQLDRVAHSTLLGLGNVPSIELAERLLAIAPSGMSKVFYSDSGSTAVEVALKIAFQYQRLRGRPEKQRFVTLTDAYHGDTLGSVSVGGIDLFHTLFHPLLFSTIRIPPTQEALRAALAEHGDQVAAFIIEPRIQGAAGMRLQPPGFVEAARALTREHDVLLICDEVATGFGRTGRMFASGDVSPDLLCLAKGISGGYLPLAATLASEEVYAPFSTQVDDIATFFHGHTYTGNPLACAAGIASLDIFEREGVIDSLASKIARAQERLDTRIRPLGAVKEIRQLGMMIGIELASEEPRIGARVCQAARTHGVILRPLGSVVVWMPPLSITEAEIDRLADATRASILAVLGE